MNQAASGGHLSTVRLLLDRGADLNAQDPWDMPLGHVVDDLKCNDNREIIRLLSTSKSGFPSSCKICSIVGLGPGLNRR